MYLEFINKVSPFFEKEGFTYNPRLESFIQKFDLGERRFKVKKDRLIQVDLSYGIKFKVIDEILSKIFDVKLGASSNTIFITVLNLLESVSKSCFFITSEEEINAGVIWAIEVYQKYASSFFEKYSTLESLDKEFNMEELVTRAMGSDKYHNDISDVIMIGLVVAKLLNKENYEELEKKHSEFLKKNQPAILSVRTFENIKKLKDFDFEKYRKKLKL